MSGLTKLTLTGSDMATETRSCSRHGEYQARNLIRNLWTPCPACGEEQRKEDLRQEQEKAEANRQWAINTIIGRSGIPTRFADRTLDGFKAATPEQERVLKICRAYAERFDDRLSNGGGLVMCGQPGTGKTHLACAIANHIAKHGRTSLFLSVMQAVRRVKDTWGRKDGESEAEALGKMLKPDLLILDEVGVQFGSEAEKLILFEIINGRYSEMLPTILISNLSVDELKGYLGERVIDRMNEGGGATLAFTWESKRSEIKSMYEPAPAVDWENLHNRLMSTRYEQ